METNLAYGESRLTKMTGESDAGRSALSFCARHGIPADSFRHAMASFASGVTAITTYEDGVPAGLIATSVCSLSADPPTLLVCVNKAASAHDTILRTGVFAVNLLAGDQSEIARHFSSISGARRFEQGRWLTGLIEVPILSGAAAAFECSLIRVDDGFTHSILVGQVMHVTAQALADAGCLLWHRRDFASIGSA